MWIGRMKKRCNLTREAKNKTGRLGFSQNFCNGLDERALCDFINDLEHGVLVRWEDWSQSHICSENIGEQGDSNFWFWCHCSKISWTIYIELQSLTVIKRSCRRYGMAGGGYLEAVHLARNNKANIWPQYQKLAHSMVIKQQKPVEKQCQVQFDMW